MINVASPSACPRCHIPLHYATTQIGFVWGCGHCGGLWVDPAVNRRVTEALDAETLTLAESAARHARAPISDVSRALDCPVCRSALHRHTLSSAGVEIDQCLSHGTWFDRDELGKVAHAMAIARAYGGHAAHAQGIAGGSRSGMNARGAGAIAAVGVGGAAAVLLGGGAADGNLPPNQRHSAELGADAVETAVDAGDSLELLGDTLDVFGTIVECIGELG